jgi:hypothetical protein
MKFKSIFVLILLTVSPLLLSIELIDGVKQEFGMAFTDQQRSALPVFSGVVKQNTNKFDDLFSLAFINIEDTNNWYRLYDDLNIYGVNVETKQYLGNWPLTTKKQYLLKTEQSTSSPTKPEATNEGIFATPQMWLEEGHENSSGCLSKNPLRYGTVNGDELLFVFFDPSVVVFSPKRGKVDINVLFAQDDVMSDTEYQDNLKAGYFKFSSDNPPQYAAFTSMADNREGRLGKDWLYPAQRSYGKIYIDDFNGDNTNDIIMWRKLYFSKLKTDAVKGYELDAEMYAHYQIVNGEYQLQTNTSPETVKGWLEGKNLTWQKGFPSKSECAGQKGQLIPKMHDPLLNDPDVLK